MYVTDPSITNALVPSCSCSCPKSPRVPFPVRITFDYESFEDLTDKILPVIKSELLVGRPTSSRLCFFPWMQDERILLHVKGAGPHFDKGDSNRPYAGTSCHHREKTASHRPRALSLLPKQWDKHRPAISDLRVGVVRLAIQPRDRGKRAGSRFERSACEEVETGGLQICRHLNIQIGLGSRPFTTKGRSASLETWVLGCKSGALQLLGVS